MPTLQYRRGFCVRCRSLFAAVNPVQRYCCALCQKLGGAERRNNARRSQAGFLPGMHGLIPRVCWLRKRCGVCEAEKPLGEFYRRSSNFDQRQSVCKACKAAWAVNRYKSSEDVRERIKAKVRERVNSLDGRRKARQAIRDWKKANPLMRLAQGLTYRELRGNRIRSLDDGTLTDVVVSTLRAAATSCPYCGRDICNSAGQIDHVVPLATGGAHSIGNVKVVCAQCNAAKQGRSLAAFMTDRFRPGPSHD